MNITEVYCDGACLPNPGRGGWAWTTMQGESNSGHVPQTTNNLMELRSVIEAIKALYRPDRPLLIISDSQYVVKGITTWITDWIKKDWKDVKNVEVWKELYSLTQGRDISFKWVPGHSGNAGNEEADRLSVLASHAPPHLIKRRLVNLNTRQKLHVKSS
jgi:ribonuclease HI